MTDEPKEMRLRGPIAAKELEEGQIVVVDGHVVEAGPDPADPDLVRVVLVRVLAGVEGDLRKVVLSVPADMKLATAEPFTGEVPAVQSRS